jgi:hypothetical protein
MRGSRYHKVLDVSMWVASTPVAERDGVDKRSSEKKIVLCSSRCYELTVKERFPPFFFSRKKSYQATATFWTIRALKFHETPNLYLAACHSTP